MKRALLLFFFNAKDGLYIKKYKKRTQKRENTKGRTLTTNSSAFLRKNFVQIQRNIIF